MSDEDRDRHWPWLGFALDEAIKLALTRPDDVLQYATPEVLVSQLPADLMATLLQRALGAGKLSAQAVLDTAPPAVLAEHLEPDVLWRCLDDVAALAELSVDGGAPRGEGRKWLSLILSRGLEMKMVTPADVVRHLPPSAFVKDAPLPVLAEMIRVGITKGAFNPEVVLTHLTPQVIAENLKPTLVWNCLTDAVVRAFQLSDTAPAHKPATKPAAATPAAAPAPAAAKPATPPTAATASNGAKPVAIPGREPTGPIKIGTAGVVPAPTAAKKPAAPVAHEDDLDIVEEQTMPTPRR